MVRGDTSWMRPKSVVDPVTEYADEEFEDEEEWEEEEEEEEEDDEEENELNFERLFEERLKSLEDQLRDFSLRWVFELKEEGIKGLHTLKTDFKQLCEEEIPGSKELPIDSEGYKKFAEANNVKFSSDEEKDGYLKGLQILENISFFQYLLLHHKDMIIAKSCKRWSKERDELDDSKLGALLLEEFFMPPQDQEEALDSALVKFSEMMTKRTVKIAEFQRKLRRTDPSSVLFGVTIREQEKFINDHAEEIEKSKIYFSAAIQKLKVKQEQELVRIEKDIQ
mmetsp:Transcript_16038/g.18147  ORF Transcript_16038/g.18147 Transcript_16038/m.18147 type:complete len:280 (-) Transcript_16038:109-948(-)|eukprot:CAMPEP_0184020178 /NCGR_PEP_ID=MMETSP0954-20121128/9198_1 /TAXON_ID=627963 /ORGANISM="Aplanochytrium sp, Strain PBS07" /LENGTH=279 /DNA_ID=CAMNT_0026301997 /DNA_START=331 /DNA_END=1170 /DNA_ORIENTATION=+